MILVDSLYINNFGGFLLFRYLVDELEKNNIEAFYIIDFRCGNKFSDIPLERKCVMHASMLTRHKWYKVNGKRFNKVLCFGNVPPSIRLKAEVYTYFHNINLLNIPASEPFMRKVSSKLKRTLFKILKKNTDYWIVQTENTRDELMKHLNEPIDKLKILPFYNIDDIEVGLVDCQNRAGYIYASRYTQQKNFEFVIRSWIELAKRNIRPELHLTLDYQPQKLRDLISIATERYHTRIINHGPMSQQNLFKLYRQMRVLVYASTNESLGLCIIEAIENGCDVIAPDLPYVHSICKPSVVFKIQNVASFVDAIVTYEYETLRTKIKIENMIDKLLVIFKSVV